MKTCFHAFIIVGLLCFYNGTYAQTTGYSGTGVNMDVKYHRFEWMLDPDAAKNITGTVTTYFKTTQSNVSAITFDFAKASFNNGNLVVKYHGSTSGVVVSWPASGNVNMLQIKLPVTLPVNTLDSVSISYSGAPPAFSDYGEGFDKQTITGLGTALYTLAESYGDDDFWPCKADMQDKIDSVDFIITTPSAYRAAANGKLISDIISGTNRIMTYKHRYPIASYLVAVAVARYNVYNRTPVNINGTNVPIVYYVGSGRSVTAANLTTMDYCRDQMVAFSNKYGEYPFKNEKYGMYEFGWGGGMEHQTFSAMGWSSMINWSVIAHELAHQWFGDKVTFATWNHLWLAEGFAKYSEVLAAELVTSMGRNPVTHRATIKSTALSTSTTPIYLSNASIQNSNTIWTTNNDNAIYQRGAMVVSMLRKLAGDDKFFQACRNYLNHPALAYRSATTEDLKNHFEAVLKYDLDAFFQDYIYGTGNPIYTVKWGSNGKRINIQITPAQQSRSTSSTVSYFHTPVVLKITGSAKDTSIVIYDQNGSLSFAGNGISSPQTGGGLSYDLSFTPTGVSFDPDAETLTTGTVQNLSSLNTAIYSVLPVNIIDFKGSSTANGNWLSLLIASSDEQIRITAERSEDGKVFKAIGEMATGLAAEGGMVYHLLDKDINGSGTYYYRTKTIDEKDVVKYSKIISLARRENADVRLSPNPAKRFIQLTLPGDWQGRRLKYVLYNNSGIAVKTEKTIVAEHILKVLLPPLASGHYAIELQNDRGEQLFKKFTVIH